MKIMPGLRGSKLGTLLCRKAFKIEPLVFKAGLSFVAVSL